MKQPLAMKRGFATIEVSALRFMAAPPPLHAPLCGPLHIAKGDASLTNDAKYDTINQNSKRLITSEETVSKLKTS